MGFLDDRELLQQAGIDLVPDVNQQIQATIAQTGNAPQLSQAVIPQQVAPTQPTSQTDLFRQVMATPQQSNTAPLAQLGQIADQATQMIASQQTQEEPQQEIPAEDLLLQQGRQEELQSILSVGKPEEQAQRLREITGARTRAEISIPQTEQPIETGQQSLLNAKGLVNTEFGVKSKADKYSGGINYGTDIAVPRGTKVAAPPGEWKVVEAFNGATIEGPRNKQGGINRGYGNSVLLENAKTGEKMRMSHLRVGGVSVKPGQVVQGGTVLGETGASGNTDGQTGQHLDLEYYNTQGKLANVRTSPYRKFLGL